MTEIPRKIEPHAPRTGRPELGPRLYLRGERDGSKSWIIRDTNRDTRTGCKEAEFDAAALALDAYIQGHTITTREDTIPGVVYFVTCTTSAHYPIKIGWTKNLANRMNSMQGGNPNVLTVLATSPGTYSHERQLHARFKHLHIRGEWFRRGDDLLEYVAEISSAAETYGADEFMENER